MSGHRQLVCGEHQSFAHKVCGPIQKATSLQLGKGLKKKITWKLDKITLVGWCPSSALYWETQTGTNEHLEGIYPVSRKSDVSCLFYRSVADLLGCEHRSGWGTYWE